MIPIFRKIRQRLLQQNRITKYLAYAFGEIILVVIGILIALQVNNWNQERIRKEIFQATIDQIYNGLELETQELDLYINGLNYQHDYINSLYANPDTLPSEMIPGLMYYLETEPAPFNSSVGYHLQKLEINPENRSENLLARSLTNYLLRAKLDFSNGEKPISEILISEGLPAPSVEFGFSLIMGGSIFENFFDQQDLIRAKSLLETPKIRSSLQQLGQRKEFEKVLLNQILDLAKANMAAIKSSYPSVHLYYENIGIIGDGTTFSNWEEDLPMRLIDEEKAIWEGNIELNGAGIKIRENKNWTVNWGGFTFPKGKLVWFGPNIPTSKGSYIVKINLADKTYEFVQQ